jgi:hypothetical protein
MSVVGWVAFIVTLLWMLDYAFRPFPWRDRWKGR